MEQEYLDVFNTYLAQFVSYLANLEKEGLVTDNEYKIIHEPISEIATALETVKPQTIEEAAMFKDPNEDDKIE